ncbi:ComEA family DNA-binding protein [Sphaerisporangium fuscum]|uniref:ComEA family DNA-binding protein n=1 Tax=Sphaerisporangium fuscum TaxID=2835868 RepID=UPI001BDDA0A5|nr:helix-hairpin-helix domain-containing protein [Sphaerisporangium fuscum]
MPPPPDLHGLTPYNRPVPGPYGPRHPGEHAGPMPPRPPFQPHLPPPPPKPDGGPASVLWALAPLLTCGAATPFTMGYAAAKLRSVMLGLSAAIYAIGMLSFVLAVATDGGPAEKLFEVLTFLGSGGSAVVGTIHSFIIRNQVFDRSESPNDYAVAIAQQRRELRQQARELAERDPALARELRIGRPDLPRHYDDGGLVDINHAPAEVIAHLPGMTRELAQRVVEARANVGGFISPEDVSIAVDLPPQLTADLVELTIYLP